MKKNDNNNKNKTIYKNRIDMGDKQYGKKQRKHKKRAEENKLEFKYYSKKEFKTMQENNNVNVIGSFSPKKDFKDKGIGILKIKNKSFDIINKEKGETVGYILVDELKKNKKQENKYEPLSSFFDNKDDMINITKIDDIIPKITETIINNEEYILDEIELTLNNIVNNEEEFKDYPINIEQEKNNIIKLFNVLVYHILTNRIDLESTYLDAITSLLKDEVSIEKIVKNELNTTENKYYNIYLDELIGDEVVVRKILVNVIERYITENNVNILNFVRIYKRGIVPFLLFFLILGILLGSIWLNKDFIKDKTGIDLDDVVDWDGDNNGDNSKQIKEQTILPGYVSTSVTKKEPYFQLGNPEKNDVYFVYRIINKKTNERVYETKGIRPGKAVLWNPYEHLKKGKYDLQIIIDTYDLKTARPCVGGKQEITLELK